jgi:hypothetical protein
METPDHDPQRDDQEPAQPQDQAGSPQQDEPPDFDEDVARNPPDEGLKNLKGA